MTEQEKRLRKKVQELRELLHIQTKQIKRLKETAACPMLIELRAEVAKLKKQIKEHEDYERNTLVEKRKDER